MFRATLLAALVAADDFDSTGDHGHDKNKYFLDTSLGVTGDLTKPVDNSVATGFGTDMDHCIALGPGSKPIPFSSNAPQFCLVVSGETTNRCCTPSHDSYIKSSMDDLWPRECSGDDQPDLDVLACFSCDQFQPNYTRHFTPEEQT